MTIKLSLKHTKWTKDMPVRKRRRFVFNQTKGRAYQRYLEAGKRMQALANLNQDNETQREAFKDAMYFFAKARHIRQ